MTQTIQADTHDGVDCTLHYDLVITATDGAGNGVPFDGSGGPIAATEIRVQNSNPSCSAGWLKDALDDLFDVSNGSSIGNLEDQLAASLRDEAPTRIGTAPPAGEHFCFPGLGESLAGANFVGGLTLCANPGR